MISAKATIKSKKYKYENTCSLFDENHHINEGVDTVLTAIEDEYDDIDVSATGCNTCYSPDTEIAVWYSPQTQRDHIYLKYAVDDDSETSREDIAQSIVAHAVANDVDVDWSGSVDKAIKLG